MKAGQIKALLDSLVAPEDRDFTVCFVSRRTRRVRGAYRPSTHTIKLIRKNNGGPFELLGTALHELAHHLVHKSGRSVRRQTRSGQWRALHHGSEFVWALAQLTLAFNRRYCRNQESKFLCDPHRPAQSPFFMTPEESLLQALFERRHFVNLTESFFSGADETVA